MKKILSSILFVALTLLLLGTACGPATGTPAPGGSDTPEAGVSQTPDGTETTPVAITDTPGVGTPTGIVVTHEGQFCIDSVAHEILVMPAEASFEIIPVTGSSSVPADAVCTSVETLNGKQVVICRGPSLSSFEVKVCTGPDTCAEVPVNLRECPPQFVETPSETPTSTTTSTSTPEASATTDPASSETPSSTATP
jgi:hypothetical protein